MNWKKILPFIAIILIFLIVPIYIVYATHKIYRFTDDSEPQIILEVPRSWGEPVSIARRVRSITILFENGHIVVVSHRLLIRDDIFYVIQIVYIDD